MSIKNTPYRQNHFKKTCRKSFIPTLWATVYIVSKYVFVCVNRATFVREYSVFWVNVTSSLIQGGYMFSSVADTGFSGRRGGQSEKFVTRGKKDHQHMIHLFFIPAFNFRGAGRVHRPWIRHCFYWYHEKLY